MIFLSLSFIISQLNVQERKWLKIKKGQWQETLYSPIEKVKKSQVSCGTDRIFPFFEIEEALKKGPFLCERFKKIKFSFLPLESKHFLHKGIFDFIPPESYNYIKKQSRSCNERKKNGI